MLRMAAPEMQTPSGGIPYLPHSGDLGLYLHRLMVGLEKLDKMARGVQPCSCGTVGTADNSGTLSADRYSPTADAYADLCGVLAACGRVDALALVQGFRTPPESPCLPP